MSAYLLYHPRSRPSGRALAAALGIPCGVSLRGHKPDTLIRWGSQRTVGFDPDWEVNPTFALARASDKLSALWHLRSVGIPVPSFTNSWLFALYWLRDARLPVLGRSRRGRAGNGIVYYAPGEIPGLDELYVRYIEAVREYRLHVIDGRIVRLQRKVARDDGPADEMIRTHRRGWRYQGIESFTLRQDRYDIARNAVAALGLDFGAVDLIVDLDDKAWVLEVNAAPAMSPMTLNAYVEAMQVYV